MSNNPRLDNLITDSKKYDEAFFLCNSCGERAESAAAVRGGRIIRSTEPKRPCSVCGEPNSRLEYRAK